MMNSPQIITYREVRTLWNSILQDLMNSMVERMIHITMISSKNNSGEGKGSREWTEIAKARENNGP
jgi:hypothetical protein